MSDNFDAHEKFLADMGLHANEKTEKTKVSEIAEIKKPLDYKPTSLSGLYLLKEGEAVKGIPRLPIDLLSPPLRQIIEEVSEAYVVPPEMPFANLLALGAALIGSTRWVSMKGGSWREPAFLYVLIVASSGSSKSPVMNTFFNRLEELQMIEKQKFAKAFEAYLEKKKFFKKGQRDKAPTRPLNVHYIHDNATIEGIIRTAADNPRGSIIKKDEFSDFIKLLDKFNPGGGNDGPNILIRAYDFDTTYITRAKVENDLFGRLGLSLIGGIQPGKLMEQFNDGNIHQGLFQRFLILWAEREKPLTYFTKPVSDEVTKRLKMLTDTFINILPGFIVDETRHVTKEVQEYCIAPLSKEAEEMYAKYYDISGLKPFENDRARSFTPKINKMCLRIALILHYLENTLKYGDLNWEYNRTLKEDALFAPVISVETMWKAISFTDVLSYHIDYTLAQYKNKGKRILPLKTEDPRKIRIDNFIAENKDFCKEFHTAAEILTQGLIWEYQGKEWSPNLSDREASNFAVSLGKAFGEFSIPKEFNKNRVAVYKLCGD